MREKAAFKCLVPMVLLILILALLLISIHHSFAYTSSGKTITPNLIITEIYPDTVTRSEPDEYVAITNPCDHPVDVEGWSITDREGTIIFPPFEVSQNQTIYVTRNASAFLALAQMTPTGRDIYPDFEYGIDSDPEVGQLQTQGRTFVLCNTGDEVILQDNTGREVDVVVYGDSSYEGLSWLGEPLEKPREGMVLRREGILDTNQREDWLTLPLGSSYHAPDRIAVSGNITAFVSPDCSFSVLQREIENATSSLYINLYQFENPYLMDSVVDALNRGVDVSLLLEEGPVGGIANEEWYIVEKIAEDGGTVHFSRDPFLNHAKYAVIDNETLIVMTENWKYTGVPPDNSFGNRGWGIVIEDASVASYFKDVFLEDFHRGKDVSGVNDSKLNNFSMKRMIPQGSYMPLFEPCTVTRNLTVIPVLAPDTALSNETILGAIHGAKESISVQQFSAGRFWGEADNSFIAALIEAARRECEVKVLLDSKEYSLDGWNDNDEAVAWMNKVASEENLDLEARLVDLDSLGLIKLHTKGLIVDEKLVILTSLNWNANSVHNREAGVMVESPKIASFYEKVFFQDWNASVKEEEEKEEGTAVGIKTKLVGVIVTLILSFAIFRIIKWYKRL